LSYARVGAEGFTIASGSRGDALLTSSRHGNRARVGRRRHEDPRMRGDPRW